MEKQNAPARKGEGVVCLLAGDIDAYNTAAAQVQYLARLGIPLMRSVIVAPLAFREPAS